MNGIKEMLRAFVIVDVGGIACLFAKRGLRGMGWVGVGGDGEMT